MATPISRRTLLAAAPAVLLAGPALAIDDFTYRGWRLEADRVRQPLSPDLIASYQAQIDIVEGLAIRPAIKSFFRGVPCVIVEETSGTPGRYSFDRNRMEMTMAPQPPDNPVLLHELLHAYHDQKLGREDAVLMRHFNATRAAGRFPPNAYMFENQGEFFAMCASVVLWGRAARPPATRENVRARAPEVYAWIVAEFGLTGV